MSIRLNKINPIIIIISHKEEIDEFEIASLKRCFNILSKYEIRLVFPLGKNPSCYLKVIKNLKIDFIDPIWLSTYYRFAQLKISKRFYAKYSEYSHILFYELDAWVFSDQLYFWCEKDYDYYGAPWFENDNSKPLLNAVGNGGFSLRKIDTILNIPSSFTLFDLKAWYLLSLYRYGFDNDDIFSVFLKKLSRFKYFSDSYKNFRRNKGAEDVFWSHIIPEFYKSYKIAPLEEAIKFSFEKNPAELYKLNNNQLPFGCHAWRKYDSEFWSNYIKF